MTVSEHKDQALKSLERQNIFQESIFQEKDGNFNNTSIPPPQNYSSADLEQEPVICMFYNPDFIIYSSLGSFYIPCLAMIVLYSRIFKVNNPQKLDSTQYACCKSFQTLYDRAKQKSRNGLISLQCIPTSTMLQPAALCHKVMNEMNERK